MSVTGNRAPIDPGVEGDPAAVSPWLPPRTLKLEEMEERSCRRVFSAQVSGGRQEGVEGSRQVSLGTGSGSRRLFIPCREVRLGKSP